jgi:hypothetical protein
MFPLPESFRPGMWLNSVKAEWFATVSKIFNDITGVGITIKKPASGMDWVIVLNVDKTTIEVDSSTNKVRIKTGGIGTAQIANGAITADKIAAAVAGNGLAGGAGTALSVGVDNSTIEISSDALRVKASGITSSQLATDSVLRSRIGDNQVNYEKTTGYNGTFTTGTFDIATVQNGLITGVA